jgi:TonB family protein
LLPRKTKRRIRRAKTPYASASRIVTAAMSLALATLWIAAIPTSAAARTVNARPQSAATRMMSSDALKLRIRDYIANFVEYPRYSMLHREEGSSLVSFVVYPTGQVSDIKTVRSSGSPQLDRAARQAVMLASPLPAGPAELPKPCTKFVVPVSFRLMW